MLTAKEAWEIANKANDVEMVQSYIDDIERLIKEVANEGKYGAKYIISVRCCALDSTSLIVDHFKKLGYKVSITDKKETIGISMMFALFELRLSWMY